MNIFRYIESFIEAAQEEGTAVGTSYEVHCVTLTDTLSSLTSQILEYALE